MSQTLRLSALFLCTVLGACSLQPPTEPVDSWQDYQARASQLDNWTVSGKLGFRTPEKGGSAALNWTQLQNNYQLQLSGPFGAGSAKITGNDQMAEMFYDNKLYRQRPAELAAQLTGVPLPVDALSWWARGLPAPSQTLATGLATSPNGYASSFEQAGWQLAFSHYTETDAGSLPGKIVGIHNSDGDRRYSFKLVISSWSFNQE